MIWPENQILEAVRAYLWTALSAGGAFNIGLKTCDVGDWQAPAPDDIASVLPAVILVPGETTLEINDENRHALFWSGDIEIQFLRFLGPTERKNFDIKTASAKLKAALTPANLRGLVGWDPSMSASTKFVPAVGYVKHAAMQEGFFSDDPAFDIEHETIGYHYEGDLYFREA